MYNPRLIYLEYAVNFWVNYMNMYLEEDNYVYFDNSIYPQYYKMAGLIKVKLGSRGY